MNCINVTQERKKWLAGMNMVLNLLSSINCEFFDWLRDCSLLIKDSATGC